MKSILISLSLFFILSSAFGESPWTPGPDCEFTDPNEIVYHPYPTDCRRYIECFDGNEYIRECDNGLWWHQAIENCDYPGPYCSGQTDPPPPFTTPNYPWNWCNYPYENGIFPYPYDCTKFVECTNGEAVVFSCPDGLWWHPSIQNCDWPDYGFCNEGPDRRCDGIFSDYFPNPKSCHLYIECHQGDTYFMECPEGLFFDAYTKECVNAPYSDCCQRRPACCAANPHC